MSDDEMPPELEDMAPVLQEKRGKTLPGQDLLAEDQRLAIDPAHRLQEISTIQQQMKEIDLKVQEQQKAKAKARELEEQQSAKDKGFGGFKKGFLTAPPPKAKPQEVKVEKKNPLEIKEVQDAMKMNDYLNDNREKWMTDGFLKQVEGKSSLDKLFTDPEYAQAIELFQKNPQAALAKYGHNKELMGMLMEFTKMLGQQLTKVKM